MDNDVDIFSVLKLGNLGGASRGLPAGSDTLGRKQGRLLPPKGEIMFCCSCFSCRSEGEVPLRLSQGSSDLVNTACIMRD